MAERSTPVAGPGDAVEPSSAAAAVPRRNTVPPPADRIAVVVNGNARSVTREVIDTLDQILLAGDLFVSRHVEEGRHIARAIVERGYGTVLTGGGDGTFTVMVTDVVRECRLQGRPTPRFGFLRLGTGNALAWVVGASHAKGRGLAADIERLRSDAGSRPLRLVEVEGYLAPFCGFGVDALVLRDYGLVKDTLTRTPLRRFASGPLAYLVSSTTRSLPAFVFRPVPHVRIVNEGADAWRVGEGGRVAGPPIPKGEVIYEGRACIASCGTIPFVGFGFRLFPFAEERSDRMSLRVSTVTSFAFTANAAAIWRGTFEDPRILWDWLVEDVTIEVDPEAEFQIGGDPQGPRGHVRARLSAEPIRLVDFYSPPRG